jgi:hypothetical protein
MRPPEQDRRGGSSGDACTVHTPRVRDDCGPQDALAPSAPARSRASMQTQGSGSNTTAEEGADRRWVGVTTDLED